MNYILTSLKSMGILAVLTGLLSSCAASEGVRLGQNLGDKIVARLHVGMTNNEVDDAIDDLKKYLWEDNIKTLKSEEYLYTLYSDNYYPKCLLKSVEVGTPYRIMAYWTNYAGRDAGTLLLFFDHGTQRLRGWVNTASESTRDKFMHERITSQLKWSGEGYGKGMTHAQVHALIGEPMKIISPPPESRLLYENHFWASIPAFMKKQKIEVYRYAVNNDIKRHVYLFYYPAADELLSWGYDHAWEEAERYEREQGMQKK